jgi:hypothetical protein
MKLTPNEAVGAVVAAGGAVGFFLGGPIGGAIGLAGTYALKKGWDWAAKMNVTPKQSILPGSTVKPIPITPPGQPQPPGPVMIPVPPLVIPDAVHLAAAQLLTALATGGPTQNPIPACLNFQNAWNGVNPSQSLATDAKYGPKTQAALQSIISPATAPGNYFPSNVQVPGPANPAPAPTTGVDVQSAAHTLVAMGATIPTASDGRVTTFQHAYNLHPVAVKLTEDGKYGPMSQAALQSVLNYSGGGTAPKNGYGAVGAIPSFPG